MKKKAPAPPTTPEVDFGPQSSISDIVLRAPTDLKPWPNNPRSHTDKQITALKASMRQFGFPSSVLVDPESTILCGHGRVRAAIELGLSKVPTRVVTGWSDSQKRAYVLADNKLALLSSWDAPLLKAEMELLIDDEFAIETTGFTTAEVDLMFDDGAGDPDDLQPEDIVDAPVSRLGDLWELGEHRLLCADALAASSYEVLLKGEAAQMAISDPPYNVPIAGHVGGLGKVKHKEFAMASGEMSSPQFTAFLETYFRYTHAALVDGGIAYTFMDWRHVNEVLNAALTWFGPPRQLCVWAKDNAGMGSFYRSQHECVHVFKKGDAPHINNFELGQHGRYRSNVWSYPGVNTFKAKGYQNLAMHPTVKPVALVADAIRDCSHRNGVILDSFAGSGTVVVAAERTGRKARAIELEPLYVDVAIQRWQRQTERAAVLAATGQTWLAVREERLGSVGDDGTEEDDDDL
jgi:DNA modification methylase